MEFARYLRFARIGVLCLAVVLPALHARAQGGVVVIGTIGHGPTVSTQSDTNFATLHHFGGQDGRAPILQGLTQGRDGKFYGATNEGGATSAGNGPHDAGVVYSITPQGDFGLLHVFGTESDDFTTKPGGVTQGSDGRLYGTTNNNYGTSPDDTTFSGAAFALDPAGAVKALYQFHGLIGFASTESVNPVGNLCEGLDGNFYGVTDSSSNGVFNTFFRFTPAGVVTTLYNFNSTDSPQGSLVRDDAGNFYGSIGIGKGNANGSVFKITPGGVPTILHTFAGGDDGSNPLPLTRGLDGNFYGVTSVATASNAGTVFKIAPDGTVTTLYRFTGNGDGYGPNAITQASDGNLYGTTRGQPDKSDYGTVFRLTPAGVVTTLYHFGSQSLGLVDGTAPNALVFGSDGNFYGTTANGGNSGYGVVFRLTVPGVHPAFFTGEAALSSGVDYLAFPGNGNVFGYYAFLSDPRYVYHFDLGYEYVFDAADGKNGVYLYDFKSGDFFYTSPTFAFPYLYDFALNSVLYYYPDPGNPGRYNTNGTRYFYNFATGQIITR